MHKFMGLTSNLAIPMPGTCKFERDFFYFEDPGAIALLFENPGAVALL